MECFDNLDKYYLLSRLILEFDILTDEDLMFVKWTWFLMGCVHK